MGKAGDILFDDNGVMLIANGDVVIGDATGQLQKRLIRCEKCENKMAPTRGVGIASWLLDETDAGDLKKEIQAEYEADGIRIDVMQIDAEDVIVQGKYV